jgi:hypothetical protein
MVGDLVDREWVVIQDLGAFEQSDQLLSPDRGIAILAALLVGAMAVLLAPPAAQGQDSSQSVCRYVWDPVAFKRLRVCNETYYPSPPAPTQAAAAAEPPVRPSPGGRIETVPYDPADEARKAQLRATEHRAPSSLTLCQPPYRMTASDGCQK